MVTIKSHSAAIYPCSQPADGEGIFRDPEIGGEIGPIKVFAEPISSGEAQQEFGVILTQPWILLCNLADALNFTPNAIVKLTPLIGSGQVYSFQVVSWDERCETGLDTDHSEVLLRRLQFSPV